MGPKKTNERLHKVKIEASNYGDLKGVEIFVTDDLFQEISKNKDSKGILRLTNLMNGKFMRGMKHLIADIKAKGKELDLVLTNGSTRKEGTKFFINQKDYNKTGQAKFLGMYREAGFEVAGGYLNKSFPSDFDAPKDVVTKTDLKKVENEFGEIVKKLSVKAKNKGIILKETSNLIESLRKEKYDLKRDVEFLKELKEKSNIYYYQTRLKELHQRLTGTKTYAETAGKNSWQRWIYDNNWIFGITFGAPIPKTQVGFNQIPDFLFPTLDGFIDILEIKLPTANAIVKDDSHSGSYRWSRETTAAIGQVVNYLHELELNQLRIKENLQRTYCKEFNVEIFSIKPRAYIVIGKKENWDEYQIEALRKLNYSLHGIEVLTYTDLQQRGESLIRLYADEED